MLESLVIPTGSLLQITNIALTPDRVELDLTTTAWSASCPRCQYNATKIHSRYQRTLADLPFLQWPVRLALHVRRFFCTNPVCPQRTFCERLPELTVPGARRTTRLYTEQRRLGLDIGGEAGARLALRQGMPVSPDTLLRLARRETPVPMPTPRALGIDDFSFRKGQTFGTILVDLDRHQPIDLLPDRSADTLAEWLQAHPGVEVISRDRACAYADGATHGAPEAIQVADRFHLLQNLREMFQRLLDQHIADIQASQEPVAEALPISDIEPSEPPTVLVEATLDPLVTDDGAVTAPRTRQQRLQAKRRARRHERYSNVRELQTQGVSIHEIARQVGMSRQTVRRFIRADQFPEIGQRHAGARKLDRFVPYLREQLAAGNDNGAALWRELRDHHGYRGGRSQVTAWVAQHRQLVHTAARAVRPRSGRPPATQPPRAPPPRRRSARQVAWLLVRSEEQRDSEERQLVERLTQACPDIQQAYSLGQAFITIVKTRNHASFDCWLMQARQSGVPELESFAAGLERDGVAVCAALRLPYSNGQVEGQVNRLKLIKRMGYGRAKFDLLRQRVLAA